MKTRAMLHDWLRCFQLNFGILTLATTKDSKRFIEFWWSNSLVENILNAWKGFYENVCINQSTNKHFVYCSVCSNTYHNRVNNLIRKMHSCLKFELQINNLFVIKDFDSTKQRAPFQYGTNKSQNQIFNLYLSLSHFPSSDTACAFSTGYLSM